MKKNNPIETYIETIKLTKEERESLPEPTKEHSYTFSRVTERFKSLALANVSMKICVKNDPEPNNSEFEESIKNFIPIGMEVFGEVEVISIEKKEEESIFVIKMNNTTKKINLELPIDVKTKRIGEKRNYIIFIKN